MKFSPAENANGPVGVIIEFDYNFVLNAAEPRTAICPSTWMEPYAAWATESSLTA